jgi:signal transduction histidine kinase
MHYAGLDIYLSRNKGKALERRRVEKFIHDLRSPLDELTENFQRLKDYRGLTKFHEERCRLDELIKQALAMLRPMFERQRVAVKECYSSTPLIVCDKSQIQHLFINLFLNALDAIGTRGTLSVKTDLHGKGDFVVIEVRDTGRGIPRELHSHIFEPFFSTKSRTAGSGMGLSVSRYIVTEHSGSIEFVSTPGKGTTFFIFLPITQ